MRVGSLFAGIGGFDLAAERAGMEVVWQSENDPHASRVLAHHWPAVPKLGDVHETEGSPVDVLTGGFPCQDYSVAGRRGGLAGDRGALWWEFHRLIAGIRPAWVVGENVPGLLSSRNGADFATIVGSLVELGYGVVWRVLDAQWFGVAQRRRRVFIVGHSGGEPRPEVLALGQSVSGDSPPRRETGQRAAPTLAARTNGGGWPGSDEAIDGAVVAFPWQASWEASQDDGSTPTPQRGQSLAVAFAQNQRDEIRELDKAGSLNAERWGTAKNETLLAFNPYRTMVKPGEWVEGYKPDPVHDALTAQRAPKGPPLVASPWVRRLTPLECERLQGFPDGWTATPGNSDTQRYRQLGNAVAVPVVEWIMRRIGAGT